MNMKVNEARVWDNVGGLPKKTWPSPYAHQQFQMIALQRFGCLWAHEPPMAWSRKGLPFQIQQQTATVSSHVRDVYALAQCNSRPFIVVRTQGGEPP